MFTAILMRQFALGLLYAIEEAPTRSYADPSELVECVLDRWELGIVWVGSRASRRFSAIDPYRCPLAAGRQMGRTLWRPLSRIAPHLEIFLRCLVRSTVSDWWRRNCLQLDLAP